MIVRDVMTVDVVAASQETTLKEIAQWLTEQRISGVPVVDTEQRVIGVVSEADFVTRSRRGARLTGLVARLLAGELQDRDVTSALLRGTAKEAMTRPAITIAPDASISSAARLMESRRIKRLPVVDGGGRLAGIITRADIVRAFLRSDADILEAAKSALVGFEGLRVEAVENGVVRLTGTVPHWAVAEAARERARRVDGVIAVDDGCVRMVQPGADVN